jgi:AraC-like DNA-binding protein
MVALVDVSVTVAAVYLIVRKVACERPANAPPAHPHTPTVESTEAKYAKSPLDASLRARIARKLEAAFGANELYRDSTLSLGSLSRRLGENEHYVSQVLNQELGTTFYELVSSRRIEHAKRLLIADPDRNVLDIALAVGFNAKSTFNSAFRRCTGMTPREFRSHVRTPAAN